MSKGSNQPKSRPKSFKLSYYDISCHTIGIIMKNTKWFEGDFMRIAFFFGGVFITVMILFAVFDRKVVPVIKEKKHSDRNTSKRIK